MTDQMVKVNLDRQRMYEAPEGVVTVGPGEVEVPEWVAEHWATSVAPPPALQQTNTQLDAANEFATLHDAIANLSSKIDDLISTVVDALKLVAKPVEPISLDGITELRRKTVKKDS